MSAHTKQPEPVAWRHRFYKGSPPASWSNWIYTDSKPTREHAEIEPLYAACPDLLQMLHECAEYIAALNGEQDDYCQRARALIARATGEVK